MTYFKIFSMLGYQEAPSVIMVDTALMLCDQVTRVGNTGTGDHD